MSNNQTEIEMDDNLESVEDDMINSTEETDAENIDSYQSKETADGAIRETVLTYIQGDNKIVLSSTERRFISKVKKDIAEYPNEITAHFNEDGSVCAKYNADCFIFPSLSHKRTRELTDEQRQALVERGKMLGEKRKEKAKAKKEDKTD
jgi:hypothetical protein